MKLTMFTITCNPSVSILVQSGLSVSEKVNTLTLFHSYQLLYPCSQDIQHQRRSVLTCYLFHTYQLMVCSQSSRNQFRSILTGSLCQTSQLLLLCSKNSHCRMINTYTLLIPYQSVSTSIQAGLFSIAEWRYSQPICHTCQLLSIRSRTKSTGQYAHAIYFTPISFITYAVRALSVAEGYYSHAVYSIPVSFCLHAVRIISIGERQYSHTVYSTPVSIYLYAVRTLTIIEVNTHRLTHARYASCVRRALEAGQIDLSMSSHVTRTVTHTTFPQTPQF